VTRLPRILLWAAAAVLLLVLLAAGAVAALIQTSLSGDLRARIPGLSAPVAVALDAYGIPRIDAATEADAAAALGFLHARDRLFEMELMRRNASGRLSEIAGSVALPQDRFMRTLGLRRAAEADLKLLPPDVRALLDAYARGVNAYIALRGRFAAPEFLLLGAPEPWTALDSLLWGKTMALYLADNWRAELARLALSPARQRLLWPPAVPTAPDTQAAFPPAAALRLAVAIPEFPAPFTQPDRASNAWAVDGAHSATGHPLLAGDPHLGFSLPGIWYLARIALPGRVLTGATAPGAPMLVLGQNGHIAWSFTTTGADTQDLFVESPAGPGRYATPSGPAAFIVRRETIHVRGAPDQVLTVRTTRHGPVISDLIDPSGPILALQAAELMPGDNAAAGLVALDRAATVAQAGQAASQITDPVQNLTVADRDGIALFVTGRVPIRRAGDGRAPQPGADGAHDWVGFAAGDRLAAIVAPASGSLVTANNPLASPTFLGADGFGDFRARRIAALLRTAPRHDVAEFVAMQRDVRDLLAADILPHLLAVRLPPGSLAARAQALLRGWPGDATMDSPAPLIFNAWASAFAETLLRHLAVPPQARAAVQPWPDLVGRALAPGGAALCGGDCAPLLAAALTRATRDLAQSYGRDPALWRWGTAHPAVFANPLLRALPLLGRLTEARIAAPGDDDTIDAGGFVPPGFVDLHGPSYRGVYDLADPARSRFVMAPGQSGNPFAPGASDLLPLWRDGQSFPLDPLTGAAAHHIALEPGGAAP
jgi:penicillin amidase